MTFRLRLAPWFFVLLAAPTIAPAQPAPAPAASSAAPAEETANASRRPEPKVVRTTVEDEAARIEELRVRGEVKQMTVTNKQLPLPGYEIVPPAGSRDPSQRGRDAGGQRVWHVLSF